MNEQELRQESQETEQSEVESLDDLPVEVDEQVKGGPAGGIYTVTFGGSLQQNHNETTVEDDARDLDDLTVNADAEVKGGPLKRIRITPMSFGEAGAE